MMISNSRKYLWNVVTEFPSLWMEQIELCKIGVSVNVIKLEFYFKKEMWFHFCCLHNITECWQHLFIEHTDYKSNSQREISCRRTLFHNEIKQFMNSHLNSLLKTKIYHPIWIGKIFSSFDFVEHLKDCREKKSNAISK